MCHPGQIDISPERWNQNNEPVRTLMRPYRLRDRSLEDSANLPDPDVLAEEIVEDLRAALAQFEEIVADLRE